MNAPGQCCLRGFLRIADNFFMGAFFTRKSALNVERAGEKWHSNQSGEKVHGPFSQQDSMHSFTVISGNRKWAVLARSIVPSCSGLIKTCEKQELKM
eukprot:g60619.t1